MIVHGTKDYVCPSTLMQEYMMEIAGGADWEGDANLTNALAILRREEASSRGEILSDLPSDIT